MKRDLVSILIIALFTGSMVYAVAHFLDKLPK